MNLVTSTGRKQSAQQSYDRVFVFRVGTSPARLWNLTTSGIGQPLAKVLVCVNGACARSSKFCDIRRSHYSSASRWTHPIAEQQMVDEIGAQGWSGRRIRGGVTRMTGAQEARLHEKTMLHGHFHLNLRMHREAAWRRGVAGQLSAARPAPATPTQSLRCDTAC